VGDTAIEANHHCKEGVTGILCAPTYVFSNVTWDVNSDRTKALFFYTESANKGKAVFTLAPGEEANPNGNVFPKVRNMFPLENFIT
jgi:hypothetical protein